LRPGSRKVSGVFVAEKVSVDATCMFLEITKKERERVFSPYYGMD
jgi:hypothetical protein